MGRRGIELALYLVPALVGLLSAPILARALGPDGRGTYAIALAVASFAVTLGALGQAELHAHDLRNDRTSLNRRLMTILAGSVAVSAAAFIVMNPILGIGLAPALATSLFIPILAMAGLWRAEHVARGSTLLISTQNASAALLRLVLVFALFVLGSLAVTSALVATQMSAAIGVVLLWLSVRQHAKGRDRYATVSSRANETRSALAVLSFAALTAVLLRADVIVLEVTSSTAEVGVYAAAVGLAESALAVSAAFKTRIQAALYGSAPRRRLMKELVVMHVLLVPALALGCILAPWLVSLLFGAAFTESGPVLQVLMLASYFQVLMDCGTGTLAVLGDRRGMVIASAVGAAMAVFSLAVLTPPYGALGAAVSSSATYAVAAAVAAIRISRAVDR